MHLERSRFSPKYSIKLWYNTEIEEEELKSVSRETLPWRLDETPQSWRWSPSSSSSLRVAGPCIWNATFHASREERSRGASYQSTRKETKRDGKILVLWTRSPVQKQSQAQRRSRWFRGGGARRTHLAACCLPRQLRPPSLADGLKGTRTLLLQPRYRSPLPARWMSAPWPKTWYVRTKNQRRQDWMNPRRIPLRSERKMTGRRLFRPGKRRTTRLRPGEKKKKRKGVLPSFAIELGNQNARTAYVSFFFRPVAGSWLGSWGSGRRCWSTSLGIQLCTLVSLHQSWSQWLPCSLPFSHIHHNILTAESKLFQVDEKSSLYDIYAIIKLRSHFFLWIA